MHFELLSTLKSCSAHSFLGVLENIHKLQGWSQTGRAKTKIGLYLIVIDTTDFLDDIIIDVKKFLWAQMAVYGCFIVSEMDFIPKPSIKLNKIEYITKEKLQWRLDFYSKKLHIFIGYPPFLSSIFLLKRKCNDDYTYDFLVWRH